MVVVVAADTVRTMNLHGFLLVRTALCPEGALWSILIGGLLSGYFTYPGSQKFSACVAARKAFYADSM